MKKETGFNLIELMVILVILGILISVSVPNMQSYFNRKTIRPIGKMLDKSVQFARVEAIQRGETMFVVPYGLNNWASGWTVQYEDSDESPPVTRIIRRFEAPPSGTLISSEEFSTASPITIEPSGQARSTGSLTLHISGCTGENKLVYSLLISGMFNQQVTTCP